VTNGTTGITILVEAFDGAGRAEEESLALALRDLTPAQAEWQPSTYAHQPEIPGLPPAGTILWHVVHLAHCARHYAEILRRRPVAHEPPTPPPAFDDLRTLLAELETSRLALRQQIAGLREADLGEPCARRMTVYQFILMAIRHDSWHAGQIMALRRLGRGHDGA